MQGRYWCACMDPAKSMWTLPISCKRRSREDSPRHAVCHVYSYSKLISVPLENMLLSTRSMSLGFHYMERVTSVHLRSWRKPDAWGNSETWRRYRRYARFCVQFSDGFGYYSLPNLGTHPVRTLQRWWRRRMRERVLAVMMAFHQRLGRGSLLGALDADVVRRSVLKG